LENIRRLSTTPKSQHTLDAATFVRRSVDVTVMSSAGLGLDQV